MLRSKNELLSALKFLLLFAICPLSTNAQVTHALGFQIGLSNVWYRSELPNKPSFSSHFLPAFSFEYAKYSDNLFWAGLSLGITPRNIPIYKYENYTKTGIQGPEFWGKVRAGLKIQRDFSTHLPFIALGAGYFSFDSEYSSGQGMVYGQSSTAVYPVRKPMPFIEVGNTVINTTFRENKRNVFISFFVRYYPVNTFKENVQFEYEPLAFTQVQYRMIEFVIAAGIQHQFHR